MLRLAVTALCLVAMANAKCSPVRYEASLATQRAQAAPGQAPTVTDGLYKFSYDRIYGANSIMQIGGSIQIISDYTTGQILLIDHAAQTCSEMPEKAVDLGCPTDNMQFVARNQRVTGSDTTIYSIISEGKQIGLEVNDNGIPVLSTSHQLNFTDSIFDVSVFSNVSMGVANDSIFNVPAFCSAIAKPRTVLCRAPDTVEAPLLQQTLSVDATGQPAVNNVRGVYFFNREMNRDVLVYSDEGMRYLNDVATKTTYTINDSAKTCTKAVNPVMSPRGSIPASARKLGELTNGDGSKRAVYSTILDGNVNTLVVDDNCMVTIGTVYTQLPDPAANFFATITYGAGIANGKTYGTLDIPSFCA